ncbi:xanthine dehydrogenase family protein molybdopterin-binding subunit [Amorphus orientalis]|uniref:Carbon-monoxide dehydrogenase large subunit n=1 Tax=Amorphus orientalis TaxID=649198 RepID=A0AAE3VRL7_9HYPH|nr:xanthine dehydrogenase family protein molybdopterin-binding subunit [Amorphus orientalis]MDQ0316861.1 carbon-monoxide dehydrogenase large subunit [Amorphus orientalis]
MGELGRPGVLGGRVPVPRTKRLLAGRGRYTSDIAAPTALAAAFLRSPHAHARIVSIDTETAKALPGVVALMTGRDLADTVAGFAATTAVHPEMKVPLQRALAVDVARWHGEPVAVVVADTRARAEDAVAAIAVAWEPLPAVTDPATAADAPPIHPDLGTNVALHLEQASDGAAAVFECADRVVERTFSFNRQTGVPMEPRAILADFDPNEGRLQVVMSHQCPHQMQVEFARLLGLAQHRVRITTPDVGGAFGVKQQLYGDELAVAAASVALERPVRFVADRAEAMLSDIQAREHVVGARIALDEDGAITGFAVDDVYAIGPYLQYPRSNLGECRALMTLTGAPYGFDAFAATADIVFQTKAMAGHYRGVGHPLACTVTEALIDEAARASGRDRIEMRKAQIVRSFPHRSPTGVVFERLAFAECFEALGAKVGLPAIAAEVEDARHAGRILGWGIAAFVEQTARGPGFYGQGGQAVSSRDGAVVRLEPSGTIRCLSSVTEQGQGTETGVRQLVARALGLPMDDVEMITGDTATTPHGGGTWGSRAMAIGGQAAWDAAMILRAEILRLAGLLTQRPPEALDLRNGNVVDSETGSALIMLADLAAMAHFQHYQFGTDHQPQLSASAEYGPLNQPFRAGTGIQLSVVEIDPGTGQLVLLRHLVVHEAGRVVNPLLVDEQIRGGVAQGLGAALFEHCAYDEDGRAQATSLSRYIVPMAIDLPDIELVHAASPAFTDDGLGIVGVGEAGTVGAGAALLNAVNDALAATGGRESVFAFPLTPQRILAALGVL